MCVCVRPHRVGCVSGISESRADFTSTAGFVCACSVCAHVGRCGCM